MNTQTDRTLADLFERRTRPDGTAYMALHANSPDWLYDAVHAAHDDELPNDWRFETAHAIVAALEDGADRDEIADSLVDIYTHDLISWLGDNIGRVGYCDEAAAEMGVSEGIVAAIGLGQFYAIDRMVNVLADAIAENN